MSFEPKHILAIIDTLGGTVLPDLVVINIGAVQTFRNGSNMGDNQCVTNLYCKHISGGGV